MGGGGCHPTVWSRFPRHSGVVSGPASLSASLTIPDTPKRDSSSGPPWLGKPSCRFVALLQGSCSPNAVSLLIPSRDASVGGLPETPTPSPSHTLNTETWLAAPTGMITPHPSSVIHTPPLTGFPLPDKVGRPLWPFYCHSSSGPPDQTSLTSCWNPPASISGLMTLPWRHPHRRGSFDVCPTVCASPTLPLFLPSPLPSVEPLRLPTYWIWEGS